MFEKKKKEKKERTQFLWQRTPVPQGRHTSPPLMYTYPDIFIYSNPYLHFHRNQYLNLIRKYTLWKAKKIMIMLKLNTICWTYVIIAVKVQSASMVRHHTTTLRLIRPSTSWASADQGPRAYQIHLAANGTWKARARRDTTTAATTDLLATKDLKTGTC